MCIPVKDALPFDVLHACHELLLSWPGKIYRNLRWVYIQTVYLHPHDTLDYEHKAKCMGQWWGRRAMQLNHLYREVAALGCFTFSYHYKCMRLVDLGCWANCIVKINVSTCIHWVNCFMLSISQYTIKCCKVIVMGQKTGSKGWKNFKQPAIHHCGWHAQMAHFGAHEKVV